MIDWKTRQNSDGGWAYNKRGCSWTEPTAFVLLAQTATQIDRTSFDAGVKFLRSMQRTDGGWTPQPDVAESTWVTALAALLPEEAIGAAQIKRAIGWLSDQAGEESSWRFKLQQRLQGNYDDDPEGWPWFPGAAAWVIPTSLGILAFQRALARGEDRRLRARISVAREFLVRHMCADDGWNHGSSQALGQYNNSYPETTGIGLTAMHGASEEPFLQAAGRARTAARRHFMSCHTAEGLAWLRIGLAAHGEIPPARPDLQRPPVARTTLDAALTQIAAAPRNPLLA